MSKPSTWKMKEFEERFVKNGNAGDGLNRLRRLVRLQKRHHRERRAEAAAERRASD